MKRDTTEPAAPPAFLAMVADPLRWRLLCELGCSDRQVRELVARVGQPQNLVSYHLGRLRAAGLVSMRRSSADRRDAYYRAELTVCRARLREVGAALHPGLGGIAIPGSGKKPPASRHRGRILFLCTGNSARSQMAEAFARHLAPRIEVHSAGSHPKTLHPNSVRVMATRGIDISGRRTRHLNEFARRRFDVVVSLCDRVREVCPEFPGHPDTVHWSIADPSATGATDRESYPAFEQAAREIEWRVSFLLARIGYAEEETVG